MSDEAKPKNSRSESEPETPAKERQGIHWAVPAGIALAGLGAVATLLLRGCWHRKMSWPVRAEHSDYSYQVCLSCGIKRLFDEKTFRGYGPYGYEIDELMARAEAAREERRRRTHEASRLHTASEARSKHAPGDRDR